MLMTLFLPFLEVGNSTNLNSEFIEIEDSLIKTGNCLEKYYGNPKELLTMDLVSKFIDFNGAEVKLEQLPEQYIRDKDYATVNCEWKIDRKRYKIQLKGILKMELYDKTPVERFYQKYHTKSPQESAETKKTYDEEVTSKAENRESAQMLSDAMDFDMEYLKIDGVGDAAVWEHKVHELKVLVGEYQFTLSVKLNQGDDYDLEKAKLIGAEIVRKACNQ